MRAAKIELYRDGRGEWRWRLRASNGRILVDSGEGYRRRASVHRAIECTRVLLCADVPVQEVQK